MRYRVLVTFFVTFLFASIGFSKETTIEDLPKAEYELKNYISTLTPEQKIGQLLMIGLPKDNLNPQNLALLQEIKPGGIILYTHNVKDPIQLQQFTKHLQDQSLKTSGVPLFISIDQE